MKQIASRNRRRQDETGVFTADYIEGSTHSGAKTKVRVNYFPCSIISGCEDRKVYSTTSNSTH